MAKNKQDKLNEGAKELLERFLDMQAQGIRDFNLVLVPTLRMSATGIKPDLDVYEATKQQKEYAEKRIADKTLTKIETVSKIN